MKVAIVGSRSADESVISKILENLPPNVSEIISGGALGVDTLAEEVSRRLHLPMRVIAPDYTDGLGKLAPLRRNTQIVEAADLVLVFWDGESPGSQHVIREAMRLAKPLRVIHLE